MKSFLKKKVADGKFLFLRVFGKRGLIYFGILSALFFLILRYPTEIFRYASSGANVLEALKPYPKAESKNLTVVITNLFNDEQQTLKSAISEELHRVRGISVLPISKQILKQKVLSSDELDVAKQAASDLLRTSHGDVIIWGQRIKDEGTTVSDIFWTIPNTKETALAERYSVDSLTLRLSTAFVDDLLKVLAMAASLQITRDGEIVFGIVDDEKLIKVADQLRDILKNNAIERFSADSIVSWKLLLADTLFLLAEQSGDIEYLKEGKALVGEAIKAGKSGILEVNSIDLHFAHATISGTLGEKTNDRAAVEEAVGELRQVLADTDISKSPQDWGRVANNLATRLLTLSAIHRDTNYYPEIIGLFERAYELQGDKNNDQGIAAWQNIGMTYAEAGMSTCDIPLIKKGVAIVEQTFHSVDFTQNPKRWLRYAVNYAATLNELASCENSEDLDTKRVSIYEKIIGRVPPAYPRNELERYKIIGAIATRSLGYRKNDSQLLCSALHNFSESSKFDGLDSTLTLVCARYIWSTVLMIQIAFSAEQECLQTSETHEAMEWALQHLPNVYRSINNVHKTE